MYSPPVWLRNGIAMTAYIAYYPSLHSRAVSKIEEPRYQSTQFWGANDVPIHGIVAIPEQAHSTIIGTYGITGDLDNQWYLRLLGAKAYRQGYAVVLFDWRAHGKTAEYSSTLTSDGLYEGQDFVQIAAQAKTLGCPAPFFFTGYSLGGQLALWGVKAAQSVSQWAPTLNLSDSEILGGAVLCPNLESERSLTYLLQSRFGRFVEQRITQELKKLAWKIDETHPGQLDHHRIEQANSIWGFDRELVIDRLGIPTVEAYFAMTGGLYQLPELTKPTVIVYAKDDPMFAPSLIPDLEEACAANPHIDAMITKHGGHVGYICDRNTQAQYHDPDHWWAWNRVLEWCHQQRLAVAQQDAVPLSN